MEVRAIVKGKGKDPKQKAVSYTHLDVYKRQTQARTGFYTAASAIRPKKPTLQRERPVSSVTATQQTATASEQPVKSSKPPKADRSTLKKWRT